MKFKYLPHTADAKMLAQGKSMEEAFANTAYATFNLLIDPKKVKKATRKSFTISAKRLESLLYDFIEELLYYLSVDGFLLASIDQISIIDNNSEFELKATVSGDNWKGYEISGDIKAATYNDMYIKERKGIFEIQFVVDI